MKRYIYASLLALSVLIYLHIFYSNQLQVIVWIGLGLFGLSAVCIIFFGGWYVTEKLRMVRAARLQLEKEAHVLELTQGGKTWIRDTDHGATYHALHLDQRVYSNGHFTEPTESEKEAWQIVNTSRPTRVIEPSKLLPDSTTDLITTLNEAQRCLIVGASNSGKTTILQHLAQLKLRANTMVVIIDPHAYPNKWACQAVGIGRDYQAIDETLTGLLTLMHQRYEDIARGIIKHPPVTVIIDEWRSITHNLDTAAATIKTLLTESRKAAFSIYVASHSDRAKPLGLAGEYDLKEGFTVARLHNDNGQYKATIDLGNGQQPVTLPGPFIGYSRENTDNMVKLPKPTPNDTETLILELHSQGLKPTPIASKVYGSKGGNQVAEVKRVIAEWVG